MTLNEERCVTASAIADGVRVERFAQLSNNAPGSIVTQCHGKIDAASDHPRQLMLAHQPISHLARSHSGRSYGFDVSNTGTLPVFDTS
jgi:hypothetical protein